MQPDRAAAEAPSFLPMQEFAPVEIAVEATCIWCGKAVDFDRAHVISRKLAGKVTLTKSVCRACNSRLGRLEEWVLRNTPLGWFRFFLHLQSNASSRPSSVPAYFFSANLDEWIIYCIGGQRSTRTLPAQLILGHGELTLFSEERPKQTAEFILAEVEAGRYHIWTGESLPPDFAPRAILEDLRVTVIGRCKADVERFTDCVRNKEVVPAGKDLVLPVGDGRLRQHFRFSRRNWARFCGKIAFETLCFFEGAAFCSQPTFDRVRRDVVAGPLEQGSELVFNEGGPLSPSADWLLRPVSLDMSISGVHGELPALLGQMQWGKHFILVYELTGWVCASVSVSGFPPSFVVLGGPSVHLHDLYGMVYDDREDIFHFLRLAHDPAEPIIPLRIACGSLAVLTDTYGSARIMPWTSSWD